MQTLIKTNRRRRIIVLFFFLLLPFFLITPAEGEDMSAGIVRLHVIANSDSEHDQYLKLRVRDAVLDAAKNLPYAENAADEIKNNMELIEDAATVALASYDCDYRVKAEFGSFKFPTKTYGNVTFPAGEYTAVRVIIGEGKGKNWWCVMYPPLCFTDETTAHFPDSSSDILSKNGLTASGKPQFEIKFKFLDFFN